MTRIDVLRIVVWPVSISAAGVVVILITMLIFRGAIERFLDRTKQWRLWKLQLIGKPGSQSEAILPPESALKVLHQAAPSPSVRAFENNIEIFFHTQKIQSEEDQQAALRRMLATTGVTLMFEQAASTMYQSQFQLLTSLSGRDAVAETSLVAQYEAAALNFPDLYAGYSLHGWLGYLEFKNLVARKSGLVSLTDTGREFLAWLASTGRRIGPNG